MKDFVAAWTKVMNADRFDLPGAGRLISVDDNPTRNGRDFPGRFYLALSLRYHPAHSRESGNPFLWQRLRPRHHERADYLSPPFLHLAAGF